MSIQQINGNIFNSKCQTIVNPVNCVGVMGKGIATVYRLRYPQMFREYQELCDSRQLTPGALWLYNKQDNAPWILNFATKQHWENPSKMEWIEAGLQNFVNTYKERGITSVAFPLLGTHLGGLDTAGIKKLMDAYLGQCDIDVEIYEYNPDVPDELFASFREKWLSVGENVVTAEDAGKITEIIENGIIDSMIALANYEGVGEETLEEAFAKVLNKKL
jgi:O-acetyl-ADP-ribose deacetylase (regulator of RNase III)